MTPPSNGTGAVGGHGVVVQAHTIHGSVAVHTAPAEAPPWQLPAVRRLVDREEVTAALDAAWESRQDTPLWVALQGPPGSGKTAVAVAWIHRRRHAWPDGALYAGLGGADPAPVLRAWLTALGHPRPPRRAADLVAAWRTATARARLAVVVDEATDPEVAAELLPAGPGCAGIVLGTADLTGLVAHAAAHLALPPLPDEAARALLLHLVPRPVPPQVVAAAVAAAAGSPRVVTLTAALLARDPRPSALPPRQEPAVPDRLSDLLDRMPPADARTAALAAAHPGPTLTGHTLAALARTPPEQARQVLEALVAAGVATEYPPADEAAPARYALAAQTRPALEAALEAAAAAAARADLAEHYRLRAAAADLALNPHRWRVDQQGQDLARAAQQGTPWFADTGQALRWVGAELADITALAAALVRDGHRAPWQLAEHLGTALVALKPWEAMRELYPLGLAAARAEGHRVATALMLQRLATVTDQDPERGRALHRALLLYTAAGHRPGIASAQQTLGDHAAQTGDLARAEGLYRQSIDAHHEIGRRRGAAISERKLGEVLARRGRTADALSAFDRAHTTLTLLPEPDHYQAARCAHAAAAAILDDGSAPDALVQDVERKLGRCLEEAARAGRVHQQAGMHQLLARIAARRGDTGAARAALVRARDLLTPTGHPDLGNITAALADLDSPGPGAGTR